MSKYIDAEKLRAEIERLKGYYRITNPYDKRAIRVCENLLSFLSTLEESEKPMNQDLEKELARFYLKDLCGSGKDEIPEATLHHNFPIMWDDLRDIARHFAEWGAEHAKGSSEIPKDLEEAAKKFVGYDMDCDELRDYETGIASFIAGAKWQEEQVQETIELAEDHAYLAGAVNERGKMMKEAEELSVIELGLLRSPSVIIRLSDNFKRGDKVRVIVLPKED